MKGFAHWSRAASRCGIGVLVLLSASLLVHLDPASAAEPTVSTQSRDVVLDYSWGYVNGIKQHLGSYKDGRSVHSISRFTRLNQDPDLPPLGSPDFLVWVDETTGETSKHEHPAGVFEDGINPGGNVVFTSSASNNEQGRMWWVLGARANELPLDIARSSGLFQPDRFDIVLDNFETTDRSTAATLSIVGDTGLLTYRYLHSTRSDGAVLFHRYELSSGIPVREISRELGRASYVSGLGNITIEQVWSRWDPRRGAFAVTWHWFARPESGDKLFGSNPFIYTEDFGATWHLADGTPTSLPLAYATSTNAAAAPFDHLALRQSTHWYTRDIGFAPDGTPWLTLPADGAMRMFLWLDGAWDSRTISLDLELGDPIGCGATREYLVCAYSETLKPGQLLLRYSKDSGRSWSDPVAINSVARTPEGTLQRINWVSFVQPADGYPDNVARFFFGYYKSDNRAEVEHRHFKNNIRWMRVEIAGSNRDPSVDITSPVDGAIFTTGTTIELSANTSDTDGDAVTVTWSANGSPIEAPWTPTAGSYTVIAHAVDGNDGTATDTVTISVGEATTTVPVLVGLTQTAAETALADAGLVLGTVTPQSTATVAAGGVINQSPIAGTSVAEGSAVNLVVSTGMASALVAPTSLAFGDQALNLASTDMTITVSNTGSVVLPISSITLVGTDPDQFSNSTNCPSQVPVDGTCIVTVAFKPTSTGTKSAQLAIAFDGGAANSTVSMSGAGVRPIFSALPTSLTFGNVLVGKTSAGQIVTITNTGTVVLPITSISRSGTNSGQFTHANGCPSQLAVGAQCTVFVYFKPTSTGSKSANLKITPGGGAAEQTLALSGTGITESAVPTYTLSPTSLSFGSVARGASSAAKSVTLANTGTVVLPITSITLGGSNPGQFSRTNNCPAQVAVGGKCTVTVFFKPTSKGSKLATLKVTPGAEATSKSVALSGTGI